VGELAGEAAGAVEVLGETAFLGEGFSERGELAVEEGAGHADEHEGGVGGEFGVGAGGVLVHDPAGDFVGGAAAAGDEIAAARVVAFPERQGALAEEVLVVEAELLEAGTGDVGESELGPFRRAAGLAALGDVLHPAARGLDHLVVRAAALRNIAVAEPHRDIEGELSDLEALQFPVAAVRRKKLLRIHGVGKLGARGRVSNRGGGMDGMDLMDLMDAMDGSWGGACP